ncbi:YebC/PmpR family DNA-binding transcriptional regulator [Candidatus Schneideria nysicola]|uniref:YebC/PmpR family DNA-binding transcriptional regulator n=1 Tax=Candidatus Schneideria nysicola TaxID=1081631 RepID=UPI001CAA7A8B|nr:YebC/PmpR family DNA-binding transcriptional regulator [Candidatus Schneideria nysicola]UAJ65285.1 YebC/PmpR family DNA-binding transcriptional regulator [Candidatus Schneideria nysicola]UAJ65428.1 YebC/PmpR family DNA-binding transcriptional regulator [Candidatus Schneideria nysicola]UAJ66352.1 YebC/PmpR family DNA-binding transcriptional regulator [Candidatus Schneideria nysicola]
MSGHSKWANTKHRKALQDSRRGKIFTKLIQELVTTVKLGGADTNTNPRLRTIINKALSNNMTRDTINRVLNRGVGEQSLKEMENIVYEGYGPGGTALIINCISNNRNRTTSEIRYILNKIGCSLGVKGSVSYLFQKKGMLSFVAPGVDKDRMLNYAIEFGADDINIHDNGSIDIYTTLELFGSISSRLNQNGFIEVSSKIVYLPITGIRLNQDNTNELIKLIGLLEKNDDIKNIFHNGIYYIM